MLNTRIIPVLLIKDKGLYKGIKFKNHTYVGDPINTIKIFNDKEVDELIIFDIEASKTNKPIDYNYLEEIVSEAFIPIGYGGGIKSLKDAKKLFSLGIEKVVLNTYALKTPNLIKEIATSFGSQSIIVSIDIKKTIFGNKVYIKSGTEMINKTPKEIAIMVQELGAGEIILNDIDKDGTRTGYNYDYLKEISSIANIPIIICGGAKSIMDFVSAKKFGANACAAGSMFVFQGPLRAVLISYPKYSELRRVLGE